MPLTAEEIELARAIQFDVSVCELIKAATQRPFERLAGLDEDQEEYEADGLAVFMKDEEAQRIARELQPALLQQGYRAFWSYRQRFSSLDTHSEGDNLAVLRTTDDTAIVRSQSTDGSNYDILTDDILERIAQWRERCALIVAGASNDWVFLEFETLPSDLCTFAAEVYDFCPDIVTQGIGLVSESDEPEMYAAARALCPMDVRLTIEPVRFNYVPEDDAEIGIRLLAYTLQQDRSAFLWWD